jgi:methylated-DNA-protein-cysteine methyltransferase-like protein
MSKPTRGAGTYARIWNVVRRIPRGKVSTYGAIARLAGFGSNARIAGYALHSLPSGSGIPWHRVINSRGKISLPRNHRSFEEQRRRLMSEEVITVDGAIDLKKFGWPRASKSLARRKRR